MPGKVRIFELAKELGLTSKELIVLFNERLGGVFEAKNQLSVVPDQIADLVRTVLKPAPKAAAPAAIAPPVAAKPAPAKKVTAKSAAPATELPAPIPTLKPVAVSSRKTAVKAAKTVAAPESSPSEAIAEAPQTVEPVAAAPAEAAPKPKAKPKAIAPPVPDAPIVRLTPVPAGQASIIPPKPRPQTPPAHSALPGPSNGIPGRPGVSPRPGQPGAQGYQARPAAQDAPLRPTAPNRRPAGNGPFRPLGTPGAPAGPGGRPFTPRPGVALPESAPAPSSGGQSGRPGAHGR
ncbi:MAG: hypothetical protein M3Y21_07990, partial [Candidatus Eremiobacteraeota bacterium]|nr:hypothetical protein [Candidatus Eremiobacteraeota bacterium]